MGTSASSGPDPAILAALTKALRSDLPKHEESFYRSRPQTYYYHNGAAWVEGPAPSNTQPSLSSPNEIRIISWNIDILTPFGPQRMSAALNYLSDLLITLAPQIPACIFLQEMSSSDLHLIRQAPWIQQRFYITDLDSKNWHSDMYGTQTLVDRGLSVEAVFRVPWQSRFERDGLFVDIALTPTGSKAGEQRVLRLCNTHLESLIATPPVRPLQLSAAAKYLHVSDVAAGILAGDLNAIEPFDRTMPKKNGLEDAYIVLGGKEDSDEGYTWGYQVPEEMRKKFGYSRMDKILFRGDVNVRPGDFQRVGVGVRVEEGVGKELGGGEWVTDHYGVMGIFQLGKWAFKGEEGEEKGTGAKI